MNPTRERFASYAERRWRSDLPLAVLQQHFAAGADTGAYLHEDFYALYVIQGGRGLHVINGHAYPVKRGDVYMTAPGTTVAYSQFRDLRAEVYCFQADLFSEQERDALASLPGFSELFWHDTASAGQSYTMHLTPEQYRGVDVLVNDIRTEMAVETAVSAILVRQQLFRLIVDVARARAGAQAGVAGPESSSAPGSPSLADVVRFCEAHFADDVSVPQLAALMFLSPGHFTEVFTRAMGVGPGAYLRQLRLEHAQTLLRDNTMPITDVAQRAGFGDSAQLSRAFRTAFGTTPSAYRRAHRA